MKNIVLIGMPSCGKTSLGKKVARKLKMDFVDIDHVIIENEHRSIPKIFELYEESGFRERETIATKQVSKLSNTVIATGGGIIKNKINIDYLKENGTIVFIDRNLELLVSEDSNRPLLKNKDAITLLYNERIQLYKQYAEIRVPNNSDFFTCAYEIIGYFK